MENPIQKPYELKFSDHKLLSGATETAKNRVRSSIAELSKLGFDLPKGHELDYFVWGGGGNNTNLRIHDPETGKPKFMLKLYHREGRCERESASTKLLQQTFGGIESPNIIIPNEVISKPKEMYRVVDYVENERVVLGDTANSPAYLELLSDYLIGCAQIKDTVANESIVNFKADGMAMTPYGIYLRYLNRVQAVFDSMNTMQMDKNGKVWGEHTVISLMEKYDIQNKLIDREMKVVNSIKQGVLHRETSQMAFNPRDPSVNNILVQKDNGVVDKILPIDFEEAGWDSPLMAVSYWLYHPDTINRFTVDSRRLILTNFVKATNLDSTQIDELNARVKLTGLLRTATYLRGVLPEKRKHRSIYMDEIYYPLDDYLTDFVFDPLDKFLKEPIDKFDI